MNNVNRVSLDDTLQLIHLVRETALARGREAQANQLTPVLEKMQDIAAVSRQSQSTAVQPKGDLGQDDFQTLLKISQTRASAESPGTNVGSVMERNRLMQAMSAGSMSDVEIARQFGVTREEVRLVLSVHKSGTAASGKGNV